MEELSAFLEEDVCCRWPLESHKGCSQEGGYGGYTSEMAQVGCSVSSYCQVFRGLNGLSRMPARCINLIDIEQGFWLELERYCYPVMTD